MRSAPPPDCMRCSQGGVRRGGECVFGVPFERGLVVVHSEDVVGDGVADVAVGEHRVGSEDPTAQGRHAEQPEGSCSLVVDATCNWPSTAARSVTKTLRSCRPGTSPSADPRNVLPSRATRSPSTPRAGSQTRIACSNAGMSIRRKILRKRDLLGVLPLRKGDRGPSVPPELSDRTEGVAPGHQSDGGERQDGDERVESTVGTARIGHESERIEQRQGIRHRKPTE